jgi:energy-converting hydrogenase Eha subunit B
MSAERVYRLLLRAYPRDFRSEYGREMTLVFRDEYRSRNAAALAFWLTMLCDVARSATPMWIEVLRARVKDYTRIVEVIMKLAGILAVLLGAYGAVNAVADAVAGMRGTPSRAYILAVVLGVIAAALLLTAGASLLRSPASGRHTATITLLASLVIVLIARLLHPWMGMLALIVGIGLPIVLLAALHWPNRRGPNTSRAV